MTGIVGGKVELAHKALAAVADWHDTRNKPPTVNKVWQRIHHECAEITSDSGQDGLFPPVLGEAFRLLREAAGCSSQTHLHAVLNAHRAYGRLGGVLHRAAGRSAS